MRSVKDCQIYRYKLDNGQLSLQPRHQFWSEYWLDDERLLSVRHQVSQQSSSPRTKNEGNWQDALRSAPSEAARKRRQRKSNKEEATRRNPSQCGSRARSWQEAGDLSPWRKECRGACSGSFTIGSSTLEELHRTLFWPSPSSFKSLFIQVPYHPSPLSSKSLIDQTTSFLSPPISVFPYLSLVQVGRFFHWQYLHFMVFRFSSPVPVIGWEVFYRLIPLSGFPP